MKIYDDMASSLMLGSFDTPRFCMSLNAMSIRVVYWAALSQLGKQSLLPAVGLDVSSFGDQNMSIFLFPSTALYMFCYAVLYIA